MNLRPAIGVALKYRIDRGTENGLIKEERLRLALCHWIGCRIVDALEDVAEAARKEGAAEQRERDITTVKEFCDFPHCADAIVAAIRSQT